MADGRPAVVLAFGNHLGAASGVVALHDAQLRVVLQVVACLHEGNGMRMHLGDGVPVVVGQAADAMGDVQFMLAHDGGTAVAQQLVVVQQRAGNGVLDGRHCNDGGVLGHRLIHLFEGGTADELQLLAPEVLMGGYVVERPDFSLYSYSLHTLLLKEIPLSPLGEAGFPVSLCLTESAYEHPLHNVFAK